MAQLLDADFHVVIHRRSATTFVLLALAEELHSALQRTQIPAPYLLVAHSFGALVARQFAALYTDETAGVVFVDALPLSTNPKSLPLRRAKNWVRFAKFFSNLGLVGPLFRLTSGRVQAVEWALSETRKLPESHQREIFAEWQKPSFYRGLAGLLAHLPQNLKQAQTLSFPPQIPTMSLYSDYPDPSGQHILNSGHWIQVDQPYAIVNAIRSLAAMA